MKRYFLIGMWVWVSLWILGGFSACTGYHQPDGHNDVCPGIYPDYADVTFPPNIAPPNFIIREQGEAYQTEIGYGNHPAAMVIGSKKPLVHIPGKAWKRLLEEAKGDSIYFRITVCQGGKWMRYADIRNAISVHPIDPYLVYRLIYPGYELWNKMGIYQRDLTSYREEPILENKNFGKQCVNCHTFCQNSPEKMMLHVRGNRGGTFIYKDGQVEKSAPQPEGFQLGATYPAWHPSGKYLAFSTNEIQQFFHSAGSKPIEVSDFYADLMVYEVETHASFTDSLVCGDQYMETFPTWTPDGKSLYFCRSNRPYQKGMPLDSLYYDLYKIDFDEGQKSFWALECVYKASDFNRSVSFPRVSPDGKYVMFVLSDYGNFSIWHPESDLYLLDLSNKEVSNLAIVNSDQVDSFHTWSSTGRWFVFSSKRGDGLWARPYFSSFDPETGCATKPFLLPQETPDFYDTFTYTYNLPELIKEPVKSGNLLLQAILK